LNIFVKQNIRKGLLYALFVALLLFIDQAIKLWVKNNMCLHESIRITDWFFISYIENNGMAFGMTFIPKYALTLFRMVASLYIIYYLGREIYRNARTVWLICLSMILAGAVGNLIDCMFYGLVFNESSPYYLSYFVPFGTGYAPFLMGKVVDMFYFPLIETEWPTWMPFVGGDHFVFFSPVFNFADASISVSVVLLLLFYREEISKISIKKEEKKVEE
jgi:signal peptidase II